MAPLLKILSFLLLFAAYAVGSLIHTKDAIGSSIRTTNVHNKDAHPEGASSSYIVTMLKGTKQVLSSFSTKKIAAFAERVGTLAQELQSHAKVSQEPLLKYLKTIKDPNLQVKSLWLQNAIILKKAPADVILHLKTHFSHLVRVEPDSIIFLEDPTSTSNALPLPNKTQIWGIQRIQVEEAVQLLMSSKSGPIPQIRVANIDSGVRGTHEALRDNYLGEYGWFDPCWDATEPTDPHGHGTHTMGTMCGSKGIGVFPEAKWMACRMCSGTDNDRSRLMECAQWMLCPTLPDRTSPNCSYAPHVISNSWGVYEYHTYFDSSIEAWRAAGIIPLAANGNGGRNHKCNTVEHPANLPNIISVGGTSSWNHLYEFSSLGPTSDGRIKPDFAAPAHFVASASEQSDHDYSYKDGTSMASPHVAGLLAVLLAYDESLSYDQVMDALIAGADTTTTILPEDVTCGDIPSNVFPNNLVGHGLINAHRSLTYLIEKGKK